MTGLDPDAQARLFYLLLICLAAVAWVFHAYRGRLGAGVQNAAIWVLIFLGVMVAYGFRDRIDLAVDRDAVEQVDAGEVRLQRGDDGHFHARLRVNGVEVRFMVDTGASEIVLSPEAARAVGIDPSGLDYRLQASTANGTVRAAPVQLSQVALGSIIDQDVTAVVNAVDLEQSLLGMAYLDRFRSMAIEGDVLTLRR